ncbi:hypothetical protein IAR50_006564 [Cryptococcus sp. DSM 104548]
MSRPACQQAKEDLLSCIIRTDCVLKNGNTVTDCLSKPQDLPIQCQHLITRFADCKKGLLDMRRRFRGNHLSEEAKAQARGGLGGDFASRSAHDDYLDGAEGGVTGSGVPNESSAEGGRRY